jgi:hypothetical protein
MPDMRHHRPFRTQPYAAITNDQLQAFVASGYRVRSSTLHILPR